MTLQHATPVTAEERRLIDAYLAEKGATICPPMTYSHSLVTPDTWREINAKQADRARAEAARRAENIKRAAGKKGAQTQAEEGRRRATEALALLQSGKTLDEVADLTGRTPVALRKVLRRYHGVKSADVAAMERKAK